MTIFRQGDVLIRRVEALPKAAQTPIARDNGRIVLAYGEVTGHAHAILDPDTDVLFMGTATLEQRFLQVLAEGGVNLVHEEHDTINLPPGAYEVVRQREYDLANGNTRLVAD